MHNYQSFFNFMFMFYYINLSVNPCLDFKRNWALNCNYSPGRKVFKFTVILNNWQKYSAAILTKCGTISRARKKILLQFCLRDQKLWLITARSISRVISTWQRLYSSQQKMWNVTKWKHGTNVCLWPVLTHRHMHCVYNNQMHPLLLSPPSSRHSAVTYYHSPFSIINYLLPLTSDWSCVSSHNTLAILMMSDLK
jgi:hypothetical protein